MRKWICPVFLIAPLMGAAAAELTLSFHEFPANEPPPGFRGAVAGEGEPGEWKVIAAEVPSLMPSLTREGPSLRPGKVVAKLDGALLDEHFPLFIYEDGIFGDFKLTTRFMIKGGVLEQMAGIAFRLQDENNFYVLRVSAQGNNLRFYKLVDGLRSQPIGPELRIDRDTWHTLEIECQGNQIRCRLNGEAVLPELTDTSFTKGRIAFFTKSDSVALFGDAVITYVPAESIAQRAVRTLVSRDSQVHELKLFAPDPEDGVLRMVASHDPESPDETGREEDRAVFEKGVSYHARGQSAVTVTLPLRDRNGEIIASARVTMDSFPGQTQDNALLRTRRVLNELRKRILSSQDLRR
jgi:hypothetical protein